MKEAVPNWSKMAQSIRVGSEWEHYKGKRYKILAVARHSETLEELVVYQALYDDGGVWVRPLKMFLEAVTVDGASIARFSEI